MNETTTGHPQELTLASLNEVISRMFEDVDYVDFSQSPISDPFIYPFEPSESFQSASSSNREETTLEEFVEDCEATVELLERAADTAERGARAIERYRRFMPAAEEGLKALTTGIQNPSLSVNRNK